jgi:hypothetical protein
MQTLEAEKLTLTEQLERALQDLAKRCSIAIRKKLEQVEQTLIRTRIVEKNSNNCTVRLSKRLRKVAFLNGR